MLPSAQRLGVILGPFKVMIFDVIKAAGAAGITAGEIASQVYASGVDKEAQKVRSHISQINRLIASKGYHIDIGPRRRASLPGRRILRRTRRRE